MKPVICLASNFPLVSGDCKMAYWLVPVESLNAIGKSDRDHAYILPDDSVWVLNYDGSGFTQIASAGEGGQPTAITNNDGYITVTGSGTYNVIVNMDSEKMIALINEKISDNWDSIKDTVMFTNVYDKNADGVIDAAALPLSSATDSDSETQAATSKAVKTAYDLAATKKTEEYGLFLDKRVNATTGYWHKLFTCGINGRTNTDINMSLLVLSLYYGSTFPNGELLLNIRQNTNGAVSTDSKLVWQTANIEMTPAWLDRFALNIVSDSTGGNYVELYIYNNTQNAGYKVSVNDKAPRDISTYSLTFTGEINTSASTTLTELPTNGSIIYSTLSAPLAAVANATASLATKKDDEYGLFVDNRSTATTGYWHKLFTCKISAYSSTDINMRLSVMELFQGGNYPCGDLSLNIRQSTNGVLSTNKLMWLSANVDLTNYLNRFALNVAADSTGNYVELYIYNNAVYHGYKVSVSDKSPGASAHTLTFTGDVNWRATTTLTELPTNGTIVYSTLSTPLASIANATASIATINNSLTALNTVSTYDPSTYLADGVTINSNYSYIKKIGKQVYIQLFVTSTTSSSDTILTLPEDVRPLTQDWSFCGGAYGGSAYDRANIDTTGAVRVTISVATANLFIKTSYVVDTASTLSATALSSTSTIEQVLAELGGTI